MLSSKNDISSKKELQSDPVFGLALFTIALIMSFLGAVVAFLHFSLSWVMGFIGVVCFVGGLVLLYVSYVLMGGTPYRRKKKSV